jgi:hypothetical protein
MDGLASASCARCVGSFFIDNKFSKAFFLCRRLNLWTCSFFCCVVSRLFALVPKSHVPTFPFFLYSLSYRSSTSHTLPFL